MPGAAKAVPAFDSEWLDEMVKKLQAELERQLAKVSKPGKQANDARTRAADARTLAGLERTLERLASMEQARALVREPRSRNRAPAMRWNAASINSLPPQSRSRILDGLDEAEAAWLLRDWPFWARAGQLPP
jgi:hypothetical protein